jgi:hypothetical protein
MISIVLFMGSIRLMIDGQLMHVGRASELRKHVMVCQVPKHLKMGRCCWQQAAGCRRWCVEARDVKPLVLDVALDTFVCSDHRLALLHAD